MSEVKKYCCVYCGENAVNGSMSHPYCQKCWDKLWKDKEDIYYYWPPFHNTMIGIIWYKKYILKEKLSVTYRFFAAFLDIKKDLFEKVRKEVIEND